MNSSPPTRPTLILQLAGGCDRQAWDQFVEIYAPLVYRYARRRGLQDSDAADVSQQVLLRVSDALQRGKYSPGRGTFRGWLFTVARNETADRLGERWRRLQARGGTSALQALQQVEDRREVEAWQEDYDHQLLEWASQQVKAEVQPTTWAAFWQTAIERRRGEDVAAELGLSMAAVYLAKSRVIKRIRARIHSIDDEAE